MFIRGSIFFFTLHLDTSTESSIPSTFLGGLLTSVCGIPRVSDIAGLEGVPGTCVSPKYESDTNASGLETTL